MAETCPTVHWQLITGGFYDFIFSIRHSRFTHRHAQETWREWCGPCKMMAPVLEQLKDKMADKVRILKIDVDTNRELASKFNIRSVPTLMLFQNGKTKWSGVGVMTSDYLANVISNNSSIINKEVYYTSEEQGCEDLSQIMPPREY